MIKVEPKNLFGKIESVSSKSMAHRFLICAALADKQTNLVLSEISEDIQATMSGIQTLGAKINKKGKHVIVTPLNRSEIKKIETVKIFDVGESGSTLRFLLPLATSLYKRVSFKARGSLPKRPIQDLLDILKKGGCKISTSGFPLDIKERFSFQKASIRGDISSQYITSLLLTSILQKTDTEIQVIGELESKPYVDMTLQVMREFGVEVKESSGGYMVCVNEKKNYTTKGEYVIEGDFSNAAFFLVAGALGGKVEINGLNPDSLQGDKKILEILKKFGAQVEVKRDRIVVERKEARGIEVDVSQIPDLLPILTILASASKDVSHFYKGKRLRLKESDRLQSSADMIRSLGGEVKEEDDALWIQGKGFLQGGKVSSRQDHRIAMSASIASIICRRHVFLHGEDSVNKSYPTFYQDFESLGGKVCHL